MTNDAKEFLEKLRPGGPWVLTAIVPDGDTITKTLTTLDEVDDFVIEHDGARNIYYSVNPTRTVMSKKAAKTDIAAIEYLLGDLDPREDETAEDAKARYLARLAEMKPEPTVIVDSGNGIQVLLKLDQRIELAKPITVKSAKGEPKKVFPKETADQIADVEARVKALMESLDSVAGTQNIDRIFRLPGTTNLPNKKKLADGRVACPTKLISFNGSTCRLEDFPAAAKTEETSAADATIFTATDQFEDISPNDPRLKGLGAKWIELGQNASGIAENYKGDRSKATMAFACECLRARIVENVVAALLMRWKIGEHIREQGDVLRALNRTIARAKQFVENSKLFEMNEKHCVLPIGGKTRVATWGEDPEFAGRWTILRFATFSDFRGLQDKYRHRFESEGETVEVGLGSWWISHPKRRQYDNGMRFMPERDEDVVKDTLNLWQGFAVQARKPEGKSSAAGCKLFLDHGLKVICSGNEEHFDYLIKREAFIAQRRTRSEIVVGLKTEIEGTGKGMWCRNLNRLYGKHAMEVQNPEHVVGKHNPHLETLLKLTADEALFAPDPKHRNALYNLTTEPTITIEPKFVDPYAALNFLNIDSISNVSHFLPVSGTARRFFVPKVSSERANDHEYFRKILGELNDGGGYEALLYYLLNEVDIRDFNVRAVPKTASLAEQAAYSRKGIDLLVEAACQEGVVPCQASGHPGVSITPDLKDGYKRGLDYFVDHHPDRALSLLGALKVKRRLVEDWGCVTGKAARFTVDGTQRACLIWPALPELRAKFEKRHGNQNWTDPDLTEWQDADPF